MFSQASVCPQEGGSEGLCHRDPHILKHSPYACSSVLIENNGVAPELSCNPLSSDSTVVNESRTASVVAVLSQRQC